MEAKDQRRAIYQGLIDSMNQSQLNALKAINIAVEETIGKQLEQITRMKESFPANLFKQMNLDLQNSFLPKQLEIFAESAFPRTLPEEAIRPFLSTGIESLINIQLSPVTDMLEAIKLSIINTQPMQGIQAIMEAIGRTTIDVADFSFLTLHRDDLSELISTKRGLTTACQKLNKGSARTLLAGTDLNFDQKSKDFFLTDKTHIKASIVEMNTICAASTVLQETGDQSEEVTVEELMEFCETLANTPTRGIGHIVGQKIDRMILNWSAMPGFDHQTYYHSRSRGPDEMPYTSVQMMRAPWGVPGPGRYNSIGRGYYYFADTQKGAEAEVGKYVKDKVIQTAIIKPVREARLIDLSGTVRRATAFLEYIRFPVSNIEDKTPRQYLIPSFVSDCCRCHGFEGIKYYGGDGYSNYVTWEDRYFEHVRMMV